MTADLDAPHITQGYSIQLLNAKDFNNRMQKTKVTKTHPSPTKMDEKLVKKSKIKAGGAG